MTINITQACVYMSQNLLFYSYSYSYLIYQFGTGGCTQKAKPVLIITVCNSENLVR